MGSVVSCVATLGLAAALGHGTGVTVVAAAALGLSLPPGGVLLRTLPVVVSILPRPG